MAGENTQLTVMAIWKKIFVAENLLNPAVLCYSW